MPSSNWCRGKRELFVSLSTHASRGAAEAGRHNLALFGADRTMSSASETEPGLESRGFKVLHPSFLSVLGSTPSLKVIHETDGLPLFHEAFAYDKASRALFVTSNRCSPDRTTRLHRITNLPSTSPKSDSSTTPAAGCKMELLNHSALLAMPNGGIASADGNILICAQGDDSRSSGIISLATTAPYSARVVIDSYYGRPFSSVNDVVVSRTDNSIWFTDPPYGFHQGFRPPPKLPPQVYRFCPRDNSVRVMAEGFDRPNGICFSPDEKTLYVTDTSCLSGRAGEGFSHSKPGGAHIYAFTIGYTLDQPYLTDRRLFAHADKGIPDGIKCDSEGNVFSGCGDGIHIWNKGGLLLGKILIDGGVANFTFVRWEHLTQGCVSSASMVCLNIRQAGNRIAARRLWYWSWWVTIQDQHEHLYQQPEIHNFDASQASSGFLAYGCSNIGVASTSKWSFVACLHVFVGRVEDSDDRKTLGWRDITKD
ncbi:hypothetical protein H2200_012298 [Cladophialophora chaetospira]|uniref:SMP-30/Gluconolactonase/LRE-like region domain-containing protein n=1 Tax=Cladophialophora chaetospira TaxID=386627 RepID=A0AA39CC91_9EURO|nr:hypothetical protein H2200_012298 [Cladophialophora chaetospira]